MSFNQSHAFRSVPSAKFFHTSEDQQTNIQMFRENAFQVASVASLGRLQSLPSLMVSKKDFLSKAGALSYSFTHSERESPNKRILAVFVHPNGYETFGYAKDEGWKHYLFS